MIVRTMHIEIVGSTYKIIDSIDDVVEKLESKLY